MSKWKEDRIYEIMTHLMRNDELMIIYNDEIENSKYRYPTEDPIERIEQCYEKAKKKYESL